MATSEESKTYKQACIELSVAVKKLRHAYLLAILVTVFGWLGSIQLLIAKAIVNQNNHRDWED